MEKKAIKPSGNRCPKCNLGGMTEGEFKRHDCSGVDAEVAKAKAALPPLVGPEVLVMKVSNGYLVDTRHRGGLYKNEPRTSDAYSTTGTEYVDWFVFETFPALTAWLAERFAHRSTP